MLKEGLVMKKRIVCGMLILCLLLLPGCGQKRDNEMLFRNGFERLKEQTAIHVRSEQYIGNDFSNHVLLRVRTEWRNGEDFYWEDEDGNRYLCCGSNYWTIQPQMHTQWKRRDHPIESYSTWWNDYEPEDFLTGEVTFRREGAYTLLIQRKDMGSNNCTLSRQIYTKTFYMGEDGEIVRITSAILTYDGIEAEPERIDSVMKTEYYLTSIDADTAEAKIQAQYKTVTE